MVCSFRICNTTKSFNLALAKVLIVTGFMIFVAVLSLIALYVIGIFNKLVSLKNHFKNAFAQIDVQLKRRYDLIPNLVETAKGYLSHERETLEAVIVARNQAVSGLEAVAKNPGDADAIKALSGAESALGNALSRLSVVVEAYPELKGNNTMMQLTEELTSTENRVAFSRQAFNDAVTRYNAYKQSFPPVLFAPMFGHVEDASLLEIEDRAAIQEAPKVSF